jgi:hypothetical protein
MDGTEMKNLKLVNEGDEGRKGGTDDKTENDLSKNMIKCS